MSAPFSTKYFVPRFGNQQEIEFTLARQTLQISDGENDHDLVVPLRTTAPLNSTFDGSIRTVVDDVEYSFIGPQQGDEIPRIFYPKGFRKTSTISGTIHTAFHIKDEGLPLPLSGYTISPGTKGAEQVENDKILSDRCMPRSYLESMKNTELSDGYHTGGNENHSTQSPDDSNMDIPRAHASIRSRRRQERGAKSRFLSGANAYGTFASIVCSLLKNLTEDFCFDSKRYAVHVLNSFFRGQNVAVASFPKYANRRSKTLCIFYEIPRSKARRRERAVCIRICAVKKADTSGVLEEDWLMDIRCSCWHDEQSSCEHTDDLFSMQSLKEGIANFISPVHLKLTGNSNENEVFSNVGKGKWKALRIPSQGDRKNTYWLAHCPFPLSGDLALFVPVKQYEWNRNGKHGDILRLQCQKCRQSPTKRGMCCHELAVQDFLNLTRRNESGESDAPEKESDDSEATKESDEEEHTQDSASNSCNKYMSTRKRPVLPCPSDALSIQRIILSLAHCSAVSEKLVLKDEITTCKFCHIEFQGEHDSANHALSTREVMLHTLSQGTVSVFVTDTLCRSCGQVCFFDGADIGVYACTRSSVYSRCLLDFWLYHTAGLGGTFREAYELSKQFSNSAGMSLFRLGKPLRTRRRSSSTCFAAFLRTLSAPEDSALEELFRCNICQDKSGRYCGIVMDGTATGILGKLPPLERPSVGIPAARQSSICQYVIQNAKVRKFIDILCESAKKPNKKGEFRLKTGPRNRNALWIGGQILFNSQECDQQTFVTRAFVDTVLLFGGKKRFSDSTAVKSEVSSRFKEEDIIYLVDNCEETVVDGGNSHGSRQPTPGAEDGEEISEEKARKESRRRNESIFLGDGFQGTLKHKLPTLELQMLAMEFLRCFTTASVPATLYRSAKSALVADRLGTALIYLCHCDHVSPLIVILSSEKVPCCQCVDGVRATARNVEPHCPSASRFAFAIASFCKDHMSTQAPSAAQKIRATAKNMAHLLDQAAETRRTFFRKFGKGEAPAAKEYSAIYSSVAPKIDAQFGPEKPELNGELFPGRKLQRPRVKLVAFNSKVEDAAEHCTKNYKNSSSHSPGLFSVHCVCVNPKLLGVSVMDSAESLSTALSVLLTRFGTLPETVYYDNACNLSKSIVLRIPWVLEETRLCCDRFHYLSHTCCSVFDPDCYKELDNHRTSGAEAINSRWAMSRSHIRYLDGTNLMPFITAKAVFINLRALYKERKKVTDVEDGDLIEFGNEFLSCRCRRCVHRRLEQVGKKCSAGLKRRRMTVL